MYLVSEVIGKNPRDSFDFIFEVVWKNLRPLGFEERSLEESQEPLLFVKEFEKISGIFCEDPFGLLF